MSANTPFKSEDDLRRKWMASIPKKLRKLSDTAATAESGQSLPVEYLGVRYPSISEAARATGHLRNTVMYRVRKAEEAADARVLK